MVCCTGISRRIVLPLLNTTKFGFRIRTRQGLVVEHLMIHGRNEADAERKLRQMYLHCEILERSVMQPATMQPSVASPSLVSDGTSFEEIVSLICK
jgi:hypothetical protein